MNNDESTDLTTQISHFLSRTANAHDSFEQESLGGKRDDEWAKWYAQYMLDNGFLDLFSDAAQRGRLRDHLDAILADADVSHRATAPSEHWPDYYARYLVGGAAGHPKAP